MRTNLERSKKIPPKRNAGEERRKVARYTMSASAIISDVASGTPLEARVGDISITGCYLDSINPFPEGTRLRLHISRNGAEFDGEGTVRYAQFGMGMGLAFLDLDAGKKGVLQGWIEDLAPRAESEAGTSARWPPGIPASTLASPFVSPLLSSKEIGHPSDQAALVLRLIEKLREKELLSQEDVASVLRADIL